MNTIKISGSFGDMKKLLGLPEINEQVIKTPFMVSGCECRILNIEVNRGYVEYTTKGISRGGVVSMNEYDTNVEMVIR